MIIGLDHVAAPMAAVDDMRAFYAALGCTISEEYGGLLVAAYFGQNKINFHAPELWQDSNMTLRGHIAAPGCGDFCLVWDGALEDLLGLLAEVGAEIEEGPVERTGGREQGAIGTSVYTRDPDRNLLEFIVYG